MIALVKRLDEPVTRVAEGGGDLRVADARLAGNVDRPAVKMIAVPDSADAAVVLWAAIGARDPAPSRADAGRSAEISRPPAERDPGLAGRSRLPGNRRLARELLLRHLLMRADLHDAALT